MEYCLGIIIALDRTEHFSFVFFKDSSVESGSVLRRSRSLSRFVLYLPIYMAILPSGYIDDRTWGVVNIYAILHLNMLVTIIVHNLKLDKQNIHSAL